MKLVTLERESPALQRFFAGSNPWTAPITMVSSRLAYVEVLRASWRLGAKAIRGAHQVLSALSLIEFTRETSKQAADIQPADLRSLDSLHVATALSLGQAIQGLIAYDIRLGDAAQANGIRVFSPNPGLLADEGEEPRPSP